MPLFTGLHFGFGAGGSAASSGPSGFTASGGSKFNDPTGDYTYHVFIGPGTFTVEGGNIPASKILLVAGGGGGGNGQGGGGGGGGVQYSSDSDISAGDYTVVVGSGGNAGSGSGFSNSGAAGGNSTFGPPTSTGEVTAVGGGGGVRNNYAWGPPAPGPVSDVMEGGSSGGAGGGTISSGGPTATAPTTPQPSPGDYTSYGNIGGATGNEPGGTGAGGGGAGAVGTAGGESGSGSGGDGQPFPEFPIPEVGLYLSSYIFKGGYTTDQSPANNLNQVVPQYGGLPTSLPAPVIGTNPAYAEEGAAGPSNDIYGGGGIGGGGFPGQTQAPRSAYGGGGYNGYPAMLDSGPTTGRGAVWTATPGLGGGGSGSSTDSSGANGGSGIVMIKYASSNAGEEVTGATGGHVLESPDAPGVKWHIFDNCGAADPQGFIVNNPSGVTVDFLVVGGGGAGGSGYTHGAAGGGGGGGVIYRPAVTLPYTGGNHPTNSNTYPLYVGKGGVYLDNDPTGGGPGIGNIGGHTCFNFADPTSIPTSPATSYVAIGGGGGANETNNGSQKGGPGGSGGGGGSETGEGGDGNQMTYPNPYGTPQISADPTNSGYGNSSNGRDSAPDGGGTRGGGGGGGSGPTGSNGQSQSPGSAGGGRNGFVVPSPFLPSSCPIGFEVILGGMQPYPLGGNITASSPEWRYFGAGGGGSDNTPGTDPGYQASGGLGGGGNAGAGGRTSPTNPRNAVVRTIAPGGDNWPGAMTGVLGGAPGVYGRGGGGSGNGMDIGAHAPGGCGGSGIIIIKVTTP